jgi:hypothetical protein
VYKRQGQKRMDSTKQGNISENKTRKIDNKTKVKRKKGTSLSPPP